MANGLRAAMPEGAVLDTTSPTDHVVRFTDSPDVETFFKVYDFLSKQGKVWVRAEIDCDDFTIKSSAYVGEDADETIMFPACGWTARTSLAAWRRNKAFPSFVLGVYSIGVVGKIDVVGCDEVAV